MMVFSPLIPGRTGEEFVVKCPSPLGVGHDLCDNITNLVVGDALNESKPLVLQDIEERDPDKSQTRLTVLPQPRTFYSGLTVARTRKQTHAIYTVMVPQVDKTICPTFRNDNIMHNFTIIPHNSYYCSRQHYHEGCF